MFANLTARFKSVADRLRSRGRITEDNVQEAVRDVRRALLEADVALVVVNDLVARVQARSIGIEVNRSVTPGQAFIKILHEELTQVLGQGEAPLDLRHQAPIPIMLVGLQGSGKTTTAGKLALYLKDRLKKKVMLVSLDTRRPAAIEQLARLGKQTGVEVADASPQEQPVAIAIRALETARRQQAEILILDTAGRSRLDDELLEELRLIHAAVKPAESLFVLDSMAGQDAVRAGKSFADTLPLTGVIVTKTDGDARGGAALSVKSVTGQPIKFIGTGEKLPALEPFFPERMASRILGMGDVIGLVEEIGARVDQEEAERIARKLQKGKSFDLADLRGQLDQMRAMGGFEALLGKLPLPANLSAEQAASQMNPKMIGQQIAIIDSMTRGERRFPKVLNGSRKRRIAAGAGVGVPEVNKLLKQYEQMQRMMKRVSKGGLQRALRGLPKGPWGAR